MICQFASHQTADQIPPSRVVPVSKSITRLGGDTPEVRCSIINERMRKAIDSISRGSYTPENEGVHMLGDVSQNVQRYLVRVKKMDRDTPQNIIVEGLREQSACAEVQLNSDCVPYSLFPGKVFGLRGSQKRHEQQHINASGVISRSPLHTRSFLRMEEQRNSSPAKQRKVFQNDPTKIPSKTIIVCGPYCNEGIKESMNIIMKLIEQANLLRATTLIATGPFSSDTSSDSPLQNEEYFEDFMNQVKLPKDFTVVLVPSILDPHCQYVYPQPQHNFTGGDVKGVMRLSNPGQVSINEVLFSITSHDVVRCMKNSMDVENGVDRNFSQPAVPTTHPLKHFNRLALEELLSSSSLYPITPPDMTTPLDLSLFEYIDFENSLPDVLVLPSSLPFAECFQAGPDVTAGDLVVCINPGSFRDAKSFIELTISPDKHKLDPLWKRTTATFHVISK